MNLKGASAMRHTRSALRALFLSAVAGALLVAPASALQVGDKAPDFALTAAGGKEVKLRDLLAKGPVVLYTFVQVFNAT